jgi:hypothetical protein
MAEAWKKLSRRFRASADAVELFNQIAGNGPLPPR